MVVADECKIQKEPNRFYRWNTKGKTPVVKVDREKKDAMSFYGGLSLKTKKEIGYLTKEHQTGHETCFFLDEIKKQYTGQRDSAFGVGRWNPSYMGEVRDWFIKNPDVVELFNFPHTVQISIPKNMCGKHSVLNLPKLFIG